MGVMQTLINEPGFNEQTGEAFNYFQDFITNYGTRFRTFKHRALHGEMSGVIFTFLIIAINSGYWVVCLAIMGGILLRWI